MINHAIHSKLRFAALTLSLSLTLTLAAMGAGPTPAMAAKTGCKNAKIKPRPGTIKRAEKALLCLINRQRRAAGLAPLKRNSQLAKSASKHSKDMNRNRFFSSEGLNGTLPLDRAKKAGYGKGSIRVTVAENISFGSGIYSTPASIFSNWIRSKVTKDNILSQDYKDIGIGIAYGRPINTIKVNGATYTVTFGGRIVSQPVVPAQTTPVL